MTYPKCDITGNNIDTILFDLDDTLIVELKSAEDSFIETIEMLDSSIDKNEFVKTIRQTAKKLWYKLPTIDYSLKIGISSWEALWADFTGENEQLRKLRDLSAKYRFDAWNQALIKFNIDSPEIATKLSSEFKRIRNTKHYLFSETLSVLDKLKSKYKLGLITNGTPDLQWKKINGGNLKYYFDCIIISGEYGYGKPDIRLFNNAITGLNSKKPNTIMVGDTLKSDIKGAQDSGLTAIWINRNNNKAEDIKPEFEITNLTEIFKIIK